jgi:hypothetical protein
MKCLVLSDLRIDRVFIDVTRDVRARVHLDVLRCRNLCMCAEMSFQLI